MGGSKTIASVKIYGFAFKEDPCRSFLVVGYYARLTISAVWATVPADGHCFVREETVSECQLARLGTNGVHGQAGKHIVGLHYGLVAVVPI
jgi:hypothetical protein